MSKKILLILTGGTICSRFEGSVKTQGTGTQTVLENAFYRSSSPYAHDVKFTSTDNFGIFSENMTVTKWNRLIKSFSGLPAFRDTAAKKGGFPSLKGVMASEDNVYDGIVIAHGTDTLAYSAALFSILLRDMGVPVFLVSSNEALSAQNANGTDNFTAAVNCICAGIRPNVYVTYKNPSDGRMYLHLASRLEQCKNYSEDFFSAGMTDVTELTPENAAGILSDLPCFSEAKTISASFDPFSGIELTDSVLKITPHVGLNYRFFDFSGVRAVLHGTYHSGTVCSETAKEEYNSSVRSLIYACGDIPVYIAPADVSGVVYETVRDIKCDTGSVRFVNGFTDEMLYVKLLLAFSCFKTQSEIDEFIYSEYNLEKII